MKKLAIIILFVYLLSNVSALCDNGQIDINSASASELDELYGVGEAKAQAIIDARTFDSVDDLINVKGIGEVTLGKIKEQGLACVADEKEKEVEENQDKEISDKETNDIEKNEIPETTKINASGKENENIEMEVISLNAKDIKSENNNESLKNNLALYGIVTFCVIFGALFLLKGKKYKNEFQ